MEAAAPSATLPGLLATVAARFGARPALRSARGTWTYRDLDARSALVARALARRGVGKGTHVGLILPNVAEWLAVAFGVWRCGATLVPISTLYRPRELQHALRLADVQLLISVREFLRHDYAATLDEIVPGLSARRAPIFEPALPALREIVWIEAPASGAAFDLSALGDPQMLAEGWADILAARVHPADPATIVFTSGSTAEPKGVVHVQRALVRAAEDVAGVLGITGDDRTWGYLPFFFTGGIVAVALATLTRGGLVVLQERFDAAETLELLEREQVTVFFAWPHQAEALIALPRFASARLALRKGVGANTRWASRLYPPDHQAVGTFGMTETAPLCTAYPFDAPLDLRAGSHGPPVAGKEVRICHPETGATLPAGSEGELCVRGPTLFSHYYGFEPRDCVDAEGFFHTGDLARLDARGAVHFLGRIKDVIKTAGVNVAAAEVEAVLAEHPAVGAAYVVGVPDAARGENVAAFVVCAAPVDVATLVAHCRARLATYKVPRHLWFRDEASLPKKGSGKVDKRVLRDEGERLLAATVAGGPP